MPYLLPAFRRQPRPSPALGVLVAVVCLVAETSGGFLLRKVTPVESLGALYLFGLLVIASVWGLLPGLMMAVISTIVFDYFLIPPAWSFRPTRFEDLAILGVFMTIALLACALARLARRLSVETEAREEADLSAELGRLLLRAPDVGAVLPTAARRLARTLDLPSASIRQAMITSGGDRLAFSLRGNGPPATLVVPADLSKPTVRRLRDRVVPSLEVLLEAALERERTADALRRSRDAFGRIAEEQAALRRLATLVAHAAPPAVVFQAVAREVGLLLGAMHTLVARYEPDGTAVCAGSWHSPDMPEGILPVATRWSPEPGTVTELVWRTWAPSRIDLYEPGGDFTDLLLSHDILSSVGCPIVVGGSLWGLTIASSSVPGPPPTATENRLVGFSELAAAAIANAQANADLKASRARVVAAADAARREIERELHDRTQQRLVSLGLELRGIGEALPPGHDDLRKQILLTAKGLEETMADLQELSRGLHPAALSKGGIASALTVLARRSPIPVELDVSLPGRLAQHLEATVYYIVCEALTNAAKHASATGARVGLTVSGGFVRICVHDDGVGGADPERGSGLIGLVDRVEAVGGHLSIVSPAGSGTSLRVELPLEPPH